MSAALWALSLAWQAQSARPPSTAPAPAATPQAGASEEIVVEGLRDIDAPGSAVSQKTLTSSRTGGALGSRATFNDATRFAQCVAAGSPQQLEWLRKVIDTRTNSTTQANAQERLARMFHTCTPNSQLALSGGAVTDAYYLRGGLTPCTAGRWRCAAPTR